MKKTKTPEPTTTYTIGLTPLQRLLILPAFRKFTGPFETPEQGRVFRRLHDALWLGVISRTADLHGGNLSAKQASSRAVRSFIVDWHQLQMLKRVIDSATATRDGHMELEIGPLSDLVEDLIGGKDVPRCEAPPFLASEEEWNPPREGKA